MRVPSSGGGLQSQLIKQRMPIWNRSMPTMLFRAQRSGAATGLFLMQSNFGRAAQAASMIGCATGWLMNCG